MPRPHGIRAACRIARGERRGTREPPSGVLFTWLTNTSWLIEAGETTILIDGAISRPATPRPDVADTETLFSAATPPDEASVRRVNEGLGLTSDVDIILIGHAHSDHSFDTAVWARLKGCWRLCSWAGGRARRAVFKVW